VKNDPLKCPTCSDDCIIPAQNILDGIFRMYQACSSCPEDPKFKKNTPIYEKIENNTGRCRKCGKRHLDFVIGNILTILKEKELFPAEASLREVGTPLISFGYQVPYPPRLGKKSLVVIMDSVTKDAANAILKNVPEIKGVLKRTGLQSQSIGILDTDRTPHTYELLSGCDMRCDIISCSFGELCIYKNQSKVHIEFNNTKIGKMEELCLKGDLIGANVVDAFCGPGTLGLLSVLAGAKKVVLNDAWLPALQNAILNIKINAENLGVHVSMEAVSDELIGDEPLLIARAEGTAEILVFHGDVRKLKKVVKDYDICLIDTFPQVNPGLFISLCSEFARKTFII